MSTCPYCHSSGSYWFFYAGRDYFRCRSCSLIFHPVSEGENDEYIRHYREDYFRVSSEDQIDARRMALYERVICCIERKRQPGSLLDVGCGRGIFLQVALRRGWSVTGIDPSIDSIHYAEKSLGGRVLCTSLDSLTAEHSYDVVTLINVLDHMLDLRKEIVRVRMVLKDGGLLYLRFPNAFFHASLVRLADRVHLAGIMRSLVIFHQYSLTSRFIQRLLREAGFKKIAIHNSLLVGSHFCGTRPFLRWSEELLNQMAHLFAGTLSIFSRGQFLIGPSLEVTALKPQSPMQ